MQEYINELVTTSEHGLITLYRGKTAAKVRSYQAYNNLRTFKGRKVSMVERRLDGISTPKLGWVFQEAINHGGRCYVS